MRRNIGTEVSNNTCLTNSSVSRRKRYLTRMPFDAESKVISMKVGAEVVANRAEEGENRLSLHGEAPV